MAKRLAFERYLWLHGRLKRGRNPRISEFMEAFEISRRQAARDIEFMRDFFRAPIRYSARDRAYFYDDASFELPGLWTTEEELVALMITKRLAAVIPDEGTRSRISGFFDQVSARMGLDMAGLEGRISLKNIRFQEVKSGVFDTVVFDVTVSGPAADAAAGSTVPTAAIVDAVAVAVVLAKYEVKKFIFTISFTKQMKLAGLYYR